MNDPRITGAARAVARFVTNNPRKSAALALAGVALCFVAWQFGAGVVAGVRNAIEGAHTAGQVREAREATGEAREATRAAAAEGVERTVEDRVRAEVYEPARARAQERVEAARARRRAAEVQYEKAIRDPALPVTDGDALRARNCSEFADLYPGKRRADCP